MRAGLRHGEFPEKSVGGGMSGVVVGTPSDASANEELVRVGAGLWESHHRPEGVGPRPFFGEAASQGRRHSRAAAGRTLESSWS